MFRATNSPILRSTFWLYIQLLVQCTDTADDRSRSAAVSVNLPKAAYTVKKCSWGWANLSPETCRTELKRLINENVVAFSWLFTSLPNFTLCRLHTYIKFCLFFFTYLVSRFYIDWVDKKEMLGAYPTWAQTDKVRCFVKLFSFPEQAWPSEKLRSYPQAQSVDQQGNSEFSFPQIYTVSSVLNLSNGDFADSQTTPPAIHSSQAVHYCFYIKYIRYAILWENASTLGKHKNSSSCKIIKTSVPLYTTFYCAHDKFLEFPHRCAETWRRPEPTECN